MNDILKKEIFVVLRCAAELSELVGEAKSLLNQIEDIKSDLRMVVDNSSNHAELLRKLKDAAEDIYNHIADDVDEAMDISSHAEMSLEALDGFHSQLQDTLAKTQKALHNLLGDVSKSL